METIKDDLEIQKNLQVNGNGYLFGNVDINGVLSAKSLTIEDVINVTHKKIGIGTNTPTAAVDIVQKGNSDLCISSIGNGSATIRLFTARKDLNKSFWSKTKGSGNKGWLFQALNASHEDKSAQGDLRLYYFNDVQWKQALTIDGDTMNVGLGTNTPGAKLEIKGGGNRTIDLVVNGRIQSKNDEGGLWINGNRFVGGHSTNKIGFWNGSAWRLTVQENGAIGIGTNSPATALHVHGNRIRVSKPGVANHHIDVRADGAALDIESSKDLYLNNNGNKVLYRNMKKVSSRKYKKDIQEFTSLNAQKLLKLLNPVKYHYKNDKNEKLHLGFIAEELPEEIAAIDKASLDPMDIITILCKVVQEHQLLISQLRK